MLGEENFPFGMGLYWLSKESISVYAGAAGTRVLTTLLCNNMCHTIPPYPHSCSLDSVSQSSPFQHFHSVCRHSQRSARKPASLSHPPTIHHIIKRFGFDSRCFSQRRLPMRKDSQRRMTVELLQLPWLAKMLRHSTMNCSGVSIMLAPTTHAISQSPSRRLSAAWYSALRLPLQAVSRSKRKHLIVLGHGPSKDAPNLLSTVLSKRESSRFHSFVDSFM